MKGNELFLFTAGGEHFPLLWIGVSDFDGSLRFETTETNLATLFSVFSDPKQTSVLTRCFYEDKKTFSGFTVFKGIERMDGGTTVIRLLPESEGEW